MKIRCLSLLLFLSVSCSSLLIAQSKETRDIGEFNAISASAGLEVYLRKGKSNSVVVESTEKNLSKVRTTVDDGTLILGMQGVTWSFGSKARTKIYVTYTELEAISASGGSEISSEGILTADNLSIAGSGGADIEIDVQVKSLKIQLSGGADLDLVGSAENIAINTSGGSDLSGFKLVGQKVTINASGGSDVQITAEQSLSANASGAADILYKGNAKDVQVNKSGAGVVRKVK